MKEVFCLKQNKYPLINQGIANPNPRTVSYGLETFGYRGSQLWHNLPEEIQEATDIHIFKKSIANHCKNSCSCNICKNYFANLGYIEVIN